MICAAEDVGNADPMALTVAVSAAQAVERIGMPESQIILSQAVTYVACAPKSNSAVNAIFAANEAVRNYQTSVPAHLRDAHYKGAKNSVMAQIISTLMIIRIIMWSSNICRTD